MKYPGERRDLQCGDCGALLVLRETCKGTLYGCSNYPMCRGCLGAHPNGSPVGMPADAATRRARHLTHELFDKLWRGGYMSRMAAYTWMQQALGMTINEAHIGNFDVPTCRRLYVLAREQLRLMATDPTHQARAALRLSLNNHFGPGKRAQRRARAWLGQVLELGDRAKVHTLTNDQCVRANRILEGMTSES